jgi:DNA-directed RNA polymerase specialized sigma24 family protein
MRWDALPTSRSGGGAKRVEPGDRALSASARVQAALDACGPRLRAMVEQVCIHGTSLQLAEQALSLRRRQGKTLLKQGLQALAEHYGPA